MKWTPPEQWADLKQGIGCMFCADAHLDENPASFKVADLGYSIVRLPRNQYMRGWTVVVLKRHANELFELSSDELAGFWQEVAAVARALNDIYHPAKINYCVFGHHCPHIHCHLLVHSFDDDPTKLIDMHEEETFLTAAEYEEMRLVLRTRLQPDASGSLKSIQPG